MERMMQGNLPPPSALGIALPPHQEAAIMKGLALQAKDRFQTVAGMYAALMEARPPQGAAVYEEQAAAAERARLSSVQVGDVIQFGGYDWRVLDVQGGKALIITDKVIDFRPYHNENTDITWADCDLREWLNERFCDSLSAADRAMISQSRSANKNNQCYGTDGGVDTTDRVFLLSLEEVVRFFGDSGQLTNDHPYGKYWISDQYNDKRMAFNADGITSWWWLRSPGLSGYYAAGIDYGGGISVSGDDVGTYYAGVRPALWLNLQAESS
jgi:hypothetical protein